MRWLAFLPLAIVLLLIGVTVAEPGDLAWWQRTLAIGGLVVALKVTGDLFEDMSLWVEEQREKGA